MDASKDDAPDEAEQGSGKLELIREQLVEQGMSGIALQVAGRIKQPTVKPKVATQKALQLVLQYEP
eukprot:8832131-Alexandrium_andersonii.AAC.1